jgi:hypothetical protein
MRTTNPAGTGLNDARNNLAFGSADIDEKYRVYSGLRCARLEVRCSFFYFTSLL